MSKQGNNLPRTPNEVSENNKGQLLERFLSYQEMELHQRAEENKLRLKEIEANAGTAKDSIQAQVQVEQIRASTFSKAHGHRLILIGFSILAAIIFAGMCLYFNAKEVLMETVKYAIAVASGGGVGYAAGRAKSNEKKDEE